MCPSGRGVSLSFILSLACSGTDHPPALPRDAAADLTDVTAPQCRSDLDCSDAVSCTIDRCAGGRCDHEPQPSLCGAGGRCDPTLGCVGLRPCMTDRDCPDDPCGADVHCDPTGHVCAFTDLPAGSPCGPVGAGRLCRGGACVCPMSRPTACGEACVDTTSDPLHCGACDTRCGAGAWCASGRCTCSQPQTYCASGCTDTTVDPLHCGTCDVRCPAGSFCNAGRCRAPCGLGTHRCGEVCVSDASPASCGDRCEPCVAPPRGATLCADGACAFTCSTGFHPCGALCADDALVASCGARCVPCPSVTHGTVACSGGACRPSCEAGYHACSGECVSDVSPASCGDRCAPCPVPPEAVPSCAAGRCDFTCRAGFFRCGDVCSDGSSPLGCGASCTRCPVPDGGAATCAAGVCGFTCRAGFHSCGSACLGDTSPASCGTRCAPCPAVEHAVGVCLGGVCGFQCAVGFVRNGSGCQALPRLIAPRSTARLTARRPTLVWSFPVDAAEGEVQVCRDRACTAVILSLPAAGGRATPAEDLPSGVVFWRVRVTGEARQSPTWSFAVPLRSGSVTSAWGSTQDFDGDGVSELAVSAPFSPVGGTVYVYPGTRAGLGLAPSLVTDGEVATYFGQAIASAGDVNGDGYGDLLVGAPGYAMSAGRASVFYGGPMGLASEPAAVLVGGYGMDSFFGASLAAGDFDGDGFGDLAVGASGAEGSGGRVLTYRGGPGGVSTTASVTLSGPRGSRYGVALAALGDVNHDGYDDLAVGADGAAGFNGRVYVHLGSTRGLEVIPQAELQNAEAGQFGLVVAAAGDVNGDGFPDLLASAPECLGQGRVYLFVGGPSGVATSLASTIASPVGMDGLFGQALAGVGDVNGDGFDDAVVGAPRFNTLEGAALFYPGGASGFGAGVRLPGVGGARPYFGNAVGGARDVDGDGFTDITVGAERAMGFLGQVLLYRGSASGPRSPDALSPPPGLSGRFGFSLAP